MPVDRETVNQWRNVPPCFPSSADYLEEQSTRLNEPFCQHAMRLVVRSLTLILAVLTACGGGGASTPTTSSTPREHPLAALQSTGAIVTPTYALRLAPELEWGARIGPTRDFLRLVDDSISAALAARGLRNGWIMPSELATSYRRNPTYATDPYALAEESLQSSGFSAGTRLPEPLASQLRTMIALHENARSVLLPIELRFDRDSAPGVARAQLRLALVDPRFSEAKWVGDVRSDTVSADPRVLASAVARHVADLVASR